MLFIVVTTILMIIAIVLLFLHKKKFSTYDGEGRAINFRLFALIPLSLAGLYLLFASMYRLDPGEAAVLRSFTKEVTGSTYANNGGIHFKAPWVKVEKFNVRNQQLNFLPKSAKADDIPITASTKDNATAYIDITITYNQDPEKVVGIYNTYRTEARMREQLIRTTRSVLQDAPTRFATLDLRPKRSELQAAYMKDLSARLTSFGVTITSVDVRGISFTKDVQKNLDKVQARNAQVEQARASLEQAKIEAEVTKTDAKAQSDADQIARCGAIITEETQVINGKDTKVSIVTPVPSDKCQSRLNEQVLTSKYIDMLKSAAAKGNTIYVVPPGSNNLLQLQNGK